LLTEGALLSGLGAAGGLALGAAGIRGLSAMMADQMPRGLDNSLHPAVLAFTIGLAVVTSLVFGLVPAIPALRARVAASLKDDATRGTAGRRTGALRSALAVAEISLAVVMLIGAGLLIKSFVRVSRVDPGFATDHVLTAQLSLPTSRYPDAASQRAFWQRLLDKTRDMPGVTAVGMNSNLPFSGNPNAGSYSIVGRDVGRSGVPPHARNDLVTGDYFRAMQIPLVEGRLFGDGDTADSPRVVIVDRLFARKQFPGESAVGQQINFGGPRNYTIVGVVGTNNGGDLARPVPEERIHLNALQVTPVSTSIVVKTAGDPSALAPLIRSAVRSIDAEQPIARMRTMDDWVARSLQSRRAPMTLVALFGAVALLLSAIGIYGVLAFGVAQRVREFGIRQAIGADRSSILSLVLRQGLQTAGIGIVLGLGGAIAMTRYLQTLLFGVTTHDAGVFGGATALLFTVALAACYIPARRATRVDPMVALRDM
jgi:predicted permease